MTRQATFENEKDEIKIGIIEEVDMRIEMPGERNPEESRVGIEIMPEGTTED